MRLAILTACAFILAACSSLPAPASPALPSTIPISTTAPAPTTSTEPTSAPSATAAPVTPPPTMSAVTRTPETTVAASSQCDNDYYPTSEGAQWQYQVSQSNNGTSTYTKEIKDLEDNSFTEHRTYADSSSDHHWTCTPDGLIAKDFANLHIHGLTQYHFTTTSSSGITIPLSDQWQVGKSWSSNYAVNGEIDQNGSTTSGTGAVQIQNKIVAREHVTVPAGTFDAYRVDSIIPLRLNASAGLFSIPVTLNVTQSAWYAQEMGMVRSTLTLQSNTATVELVSYNP